MQRAAKGSFHAAADRLLPLTLHCPPTDYGEIKTCRFRPSEIHYVGDSAGRVCHRGCDKWVRAERPRHQPRPCPLTDLLLRRHPPRLRPEPCLNPRKLQLVQEDGWIFHPAGSECKGAGIHLLYLCPVRFIRGSRACSDPYTLCRPAC